MLPAGYPVVSWRDLPTTGTIRLVRRTLGGTVAWVEADGTLHRGRAGVAHALIACGGRNGPVGHAMATPYVGRAVSLLWRRL
jgi:hypothetical protein